MMCFFFKQKTAYEVRISEWSSDVCSSDLRKGNLSVAEAREDIAIAEYERTIQGAFREVADALAGRRWLAEQVAAQVRATAAQRAIADLARTRYREGVANYLEVLDAERNLFIAEQT